MQLLHLSPLSQRCRWQLAVLAAVSRSKMTPALEAITPCNFIDGGRLQPGLGVLATQGLVNLLKALGSQQFLRPQPKKLFAALDQAAP